LWGLGGQKSHKKSDISDKTIKTKAGRVEVRKGRGNWLARTRPGSREVNRDCGRDPEGSEGKEGASRRSLGGSRLGLSLSAQSRRRMGTNARVVTRKRCTGHDRVGRKEGDNLRGGSREMRILMTGMGAWGRNLRLSQERFLEITRKVPVGKGSGKIHG